MKAVYKYKLETIEKQTIKVRSKTLLSVKNQREEVVVYFLVDDCLPEIEYEFLILGTGFKTEVLTSDYEFIDTLSFVNGELMVHVFYRRRDSLK